MNRIAVSGIALMALIAVPAYGAGITDETSCRSEIETIKSLDDNSDVGPKFEPVVKDLIDVLEHLCKQSDFGAADDVAGAIRTILAHRITG